jgi:hypothetical protein
MFENAKLKLQRAEKHVRDMQTLFSSFMQTHPYRLAINREGNVSVIRVAVDPLPDEIRLIIGDAIHNVRVVADHLYWELLGVDKGTQDRWAKFPVGDSRESFEAAARGAKTPRQDTRDFLATLGVYPGGPRDVLYAIHLLNNVDKHRVILAVAGIAAISNVTLVDRRNENRFHIDRIMTDRSGQGALGLDGSSQFELEGDYQVAAGVFFGEVEGAPNEPVLPILTNAINAMADIIADTERFVLGRAAEA